MLCFDADVSDLVINFLSEFKEKEKIKFIKNTYKKYTNIKATRYFDQKKMIQIMKKEIKEKKFFLGCFDSKRTLKVVRKVLEREIEKDHEFKSKAQIKVYTSDGNLPIHDVDKEWEHCIVLMSPKITIGVDWNPKEKRDVFVFIDNCSINPLGVVQQITRS